MIEPQMTLTQVAFAVCTALDSAGIKAVLTGGSAASFYAPSAYQSSDLDYVLGWGADTAELEQILSGLGYSRNGRIYVHPNHALTLDFPAGPLGIGNDLDVEPITHRSGDEVLHVISATDSVRDRLAGFIHWHDLASLDQAVSVARAQEVDLEAIRDWCRREDASKSYEQFVRHLQRRTAD